jgi:Na+(H+)/acetate symporter ActP
MGGGIRIGTGILVIIGLVIFYAVYGGVNTSTWDTTVVALVGLIALGMAISGLMDVLGIKIKF